MDKNKNLTAKCTAVLLVFVFVSIPIFPVFALSATDIIKQQEAEQKARIAAQNAAIIAGAEAKTQTQTTNTTKTTYTYDVNGQRIKMTVVDPVKGINTTTYYISKYYEETYDNNNPSATPKIVKHIFANDIEVQTVFGTGKDAKTYNTLTDTLGNVTGLVDSTGKLVETTDYYPFGQIRTNKKIDPATPSSPNKFLDQKYDEQTGLNYLNARYYNSGIGRFLSQDPVALAIGDNEKIKQLTGKSQEEILQDPQQLNLYSYARNNPITLSDPTGKSPAFLLPLLPLLIYAPQITSYANSLLTPLGQFGFNQATEDLKQGHYGWAVFGLMTAGEAPETNAAKGLKIPEGFSLGQKVEGFGKVVENTSEKIKGFFRAEAPEPYHGLDRTIERGVTPKMLLDTVKNPLITFEQVNGNIYKLSQQAAVVLDQAGKVVTTYSKDQFVPRITNLLDKILK